MSFCVPPPLLLTHIAIPSLPLASTIKEPYFFSFLSSCSPPFRDVGRFHNPPFPLAVRVFFFSSLRFTSHLEIFFPSFDFLFFSNPPFLQQVQKRHLFKGLFLPFLFFYPLCPVTLPEKISFFLTISRIGNILVISPILSFSALPPFFLATDSCAPHNSSLIVEFYFFFLSPARPDFIAFSYRCSFFPLK